jgi:hypothetical protein
MTVVIKFFDYSFYRLSRIYYRWDGIGASTATIIVTLVQVLYLTEPLMYLYFRFLDYNARQEYKSLGGIILVLVLFSLFYLNDKRYQRIYASLDAKYRTGGSKTIKRINMILIIVVFVIPLIIPFLVIPIIKK